jgi:hypothetical protein
MLAVSLGGHSSGRVRGPVPSVSPNPRSLVTLPADRGFLRLPLPAVPSVTASESPAVTSATPTSTPASASPDGRPSGGTGRVLHAAVVTQPSVSADTPTGGPNLTPRAYAAALVQSPGQMACLDKLWTHESQWEWNARNTRSGAYGIPQALPASKMAAAGSDWQTNPQTQIDWGLDYIKQRYGTPCAAWAYWIRHSSY